ncbi:MAG: epoxyqueuosine reductase QueH, partial [Spirochaetales bacterium]|nr:epoxyqueuosine reductase QueH [Spirochaetales bacterium]
KRLGIDCFTTTLTVSRFKNSSNIFKVGSKFNGFEAIDFKKKDGFAKSCQMAKEMGLYRQGYCGCEFSIAEGVEDA